MPESHEPHLEPEEFRSAGTEGLQRSQDADGQPDSRWDHDKAEVMAHIEHLSHAPGDSQLDAYRRARQRALEVTFDDGYVADYHRAKIKDSKDLLGRLRQRIAESTDVQERQELQVRADRIEKDIEEAESPAHLKELHDQDYVKNAAKLYDPVADVYDMNPDYFSSLDPLEFYRIAREYIEATEQIAVHQEKIEQLQDQLTGWQQRMHEVQAAMHLTQAGPEQTS